MQVFLEASNSLTGYHTDTLQGSKNPEGSQSVEADIRAPIVRVSLSHLVHYNCHVPIKEI